MARSGGPRAAGERQPSLPEVPFVLDAAVRTPDSSALVLRAGGRTLGRIDAERAEALQLEAGSVIDEPLAAALVPALAARGAVDLGLRLLAVRDRSTAELHRRLAQAYGEAAASAAVSRLGRYLDDAAFARAWVQQHHGPRPLGQAGLLAGLRRAGVAPAIAAAAVAEVSGPDPASAEAEACWTLAAARWQRLQALPAEQAVRRLWGYLGRRGFAAATIARVLARLQALPAGRD